MLQKIYKSLQTVKKETNIETKWKALNHYKSSKWLALIFLNRFTTNSVTSQENHLCAQQHDSATTCSPQWKNHRDAVSWQEVNHRSRSSQHGNLMVFASRFYWWIKTELQWWMGGNLLMAASVIWPRGRVMMCRIGWPGLQPLNHDPGETVQLGVKLTTEWRTQGDWKVRRTFETLVRQVRNPSEVTLSEDGSKRRKNSKTS